MRNSPLWRPNTDPVVPKLAAALRLPITWQMSFLYAVAFGGFVAFSTYLPTYLKDVYAFDLDGGRHAHRGLRHRGRGRPARSAASSVDRIGPRAVLGISLAGPRRSPSCSRSEPPLELPAGLSFVLDRVLPRPRHRRRVRLGRQGAPPPSGSAA